MLLAQIDARIAHIQDTITATTAQVEGYQKSLQQATLQLQALHGHLSECKHWKDEFLNQVDGIPNQSDEKLRPLEGCNDDINQQSQEQIA